MNMNFLEYFPCLFRALLCHYHPCRYQLSWLKNVYPDAISLSLRVNFKVHFSEYPESTTLGRTDIRVHIYHQPFYATIRFKLMNPKEKQHSPVDIGVNPTYSFPRVRNMVMKELATFSFSLLSWTLQ